MKQIIYLVKQNSRKRFLLLILFMAHAGLSFSHTQNLFDTNNTSPKIREVKFTSQTSLQIHFSTPMDTRFSTQIDSYYLYEKESGEIIKILSVQNDEEFYHLTLGSKILPNLSYCLNILSMPNDLGIILEDTTVCLNYKLLEFPQKGDVLFSEIMFEVDEFHFEYLEIYNISNKRIRASDLGLASVNSIDYSFKKKYTFLVDTLQMIEPQQYYVLCKENYEFPPLFQPCNPENVIVVKSMPTLVNTEGAWAIIRLQDTAYLDCFAYSTKMHFPLLKSVKNVALERVSWYREASDFNNWTSACQHMEFCSPTCPNCAHENPLVDEGYFTFSPEVVSPNQDGYNDRLEIKYNLNQSGWIGNIRIFDAQGRLIIHLVNQQYIGATGSFFWEGLNAKNQPLRTGIYIIHIHMLDLQGRVLKAKKAIVLK